MVSRDWVIVPLGKVVTLQRGYDLPNRLRRLGEIPIVTSSGIGGTHSEAMVSGPGVVTGRYGTIGEVFYIESEFWPLNTTLFVRDFHGNDPLFVSYLLRTIDFQTHSGKSGVPGVNRNDLHEVVVTLPPTKAEQEAIAEALSDADALIESLEELIAKKRHIKQGAMQELLTGKKRLPGFETQPGYKQTEVGVIPEDWEVKQIGDLQPFITSGSRGWAAFYSDRGAPFIRITNLSRASVYLDLEDLRLVNLPKNDSEAARIQLQDGDILISITADIGTIGYISARVPKPAYINQHIALVRFDPSQTNSKFVSYFLVSEKPQKLFRALTDSGAKAGMNLTTVQQIRLALPPTKAEQQAITTILSDMDTEVAALGEKLAKARQLKQGMMQELLTGKTRLVDSGE